MFVVTYIRAGFGNDRVPTQQLLGPFATDEEAKAFVEAMNGFFATGKFGVMSVLPVPEWWRYIKPIDLVDPELERILAEEEEIERKAREAGVKEDEFVKSCEPVLASCGHRKYTGTEQCITAECPNIYTGAPWV